MATTNPGGSRPSRSFPEAITRLLRHEVGDLLQSIYATAAILQRRLPADWDLERRIVADLRARAESCKNLLDGVHDFVCPLTLNLESVNLAELAAKLVAEFAPKHPQLQIRAEARATPVIRADTKRLTQVGNLLLANACESAQRQVSFQTATGPGAGEAEWTVTDDGAGVPADQTDRLFNPFATTRHGHLGVGLAMARKLVLVHGGRITAENLPAGGFRVRILLPKVPPENGQGETPADFFTGETEERPVTVEQPGQKTL